MSLEKWGVSIRPEEVKAYRDANELPLMVAKKELLKQKKLATISVIQNAGDMETKINFILDIIADSIRNK